MKPIAWTLSLPLLILFALADTADAQNPTPYPMPFEARVTDAFGDPITDFDFFVGVAIYDTPTGGTLLYTTSKSVDIVNGLLGFEFGEGSDSSLSQLFAEHSDLYLGLTLGSGGAELVPRMRLGASGYAYHAASADNAVGHITPTSITIDGTQVIDTSGNWTGNPTGLIGPVGPVGPQGPPGPTGPSGSGSFSLPYIGSHTSGSAAFELSNTGGGAAMHLNGGVTLGESAGIFSNPQIQLEDNQGDGGSLVQLNSGLARKIQLDAWSPLGGSEIYLFDQLGDEAVHLMSTAGSANSAGLDLYDSELDSLRVNLRAQETANTGAVLRMYNSLGLLTVDLDAEATTSGGRLDLGDASGTHTLSLVADFGGTGHSRIICDELEIRGGADLVEGFDAGDTAPEPGTVMSIDADNPGALRIADSAYDTCVAGIVSGAKGVRPGLHLSQVDVLDGATPIALTGRVYVRCSTENGVIRPGDLLTTAALQGHAMRATDPQRRPGAVIGKAMQALDNSTGLVLVLVSLQ